MTHHPAAHGFTDTELPAQDRYRAFAVDTPQGPLAVAEWAPRQDAKADERADARTPTVLAIHGVTSNHRAWSYLAAALPHARILAPDLRGRGCSAAVGEPYGMRAHAQDMTRVLDACHAQQTMVVGHSMGAYVAVVTAGQTPDRVSQLLLVDGGVPLTPPPHDPDEAAGSGPHSAAEGEQLSEADVDAIIDQVTAPIAARLTTQFSSLDEAIAYWRQHPAFAADWSPMMEDYARYDLAGTEPPLQSRVSLAAMKADSKDLMTNPDVLATLQRLSHPTHWVTAERGLRDETPGLYSPDLIKAWRRYLPHLRWQHAEDLNHYTIVMSQRGAQLLADTAKQAMA